MSTRPTLALVAHDAKKDAMVEFAARNTDKLAGFRLVATGTTGGRIAARCPSLDITPLKSGPLGGDQQIGAMIAEGRLQGLFFFVDPLSPMPHDVDVKALMRLALVYDLPMALNLSTAEILLRSARLTGLKTTSTTPEVSVSS
ncbi:methylglyoxal synthase [Roseibium sp.]|uniref:methylglyoxal synthase n=1 Tax=Roseibium sp. TaxID=1936156 RepID=UPI003A9831BF